MNTILGKFAYAARLVLVSTAAVWPMVGVTGDEGTRLYVLDCGYMDMEGWQGFQTFYGFSESAVAVPAQANPCFLIIHKGRSLLWDAGLPDMTPSTPVQTEYGVKFSLQSKLLDQLSALNYPPRKIDYLALSHLHFDHIGNLEYFVNVKTLIQRDEWNAARQAGPNDIGYNKKFHSQLDDFTQLILLDNDLDVFGDGKVRIVRTPGHTPGHQSLLVHLKQYGSIVISGDAIHFLEELSTPAETPTNAASVRHNAALGQLIEMTRDANAELWIQHDPVQNKGRRYAPDFYE